MAGDKNNKPARRRVRLLSEDEHRLWRAVVKDARPLSADQIIPEVEYTSKPEETSAFKPAPVSRPTPPPSLRRQQQTTGVSAPPLTGLDRRTSQRLARGQVEVEARLDLHGMRQDEAEFALYRFLTRARHEGRRCVLVITGKGESPFARHTLHSARYHEASDHSGVLRSVLPQWLGASRFRAEIAGFQPAHPRHGGGGAFYIWLRKRRA